MKPRDVAIAFLDHAAAGRAEEAIALLSPACACWYTGGGDVSRDAFADGFRALNSMIAGEARFDIADIVEDGDRVAIEYQGHIPLKNGRIYANVYHGKFVVRDGLIVVMREYLDPLMVAAAFSTPE